MPQITDEEFLAHYDPDAFAHPSLTVDVVIASVGVDGVQVVLARRNAAPQQGYWALPGGFVGLEESLEDAVARVVVAKTGLSNLAAEQLFTFGSPSRDPRTRVVSSAYLALVPHARLLEHVTVSEHDLCVARLIDTPAGLVIRDDDGADVAVAFDHAEILRTARERLRAQVEYRSIAVRVLPDSFTLRQLQAVHEALAGRRVDRDSFRRRMLATGWLEATGAQSRGAHRPAELFRLAEVPAEIARGFDPTASPEWRAAMASLGDERA